MQVYVVRLSISIFTMQNTILSGYHRFWNDRTALKVLNEGRTQYS